ncbi:biotin-independent malonate decarboxylase subunit gamma [Xenorhabdus sp. IM139775]|uniref:biotin-independent malonate decarboxylase subunit gamma n=1 Tax=Xenorhabdus sp. IM139775 TaxID=3025876 RepID=UPI002359F76A|nr:biotin-independent malonate decarboxylase subunit gamma [Xenorhabdus sp. IM139775]MDC9592754.1 biotin-independent malonate decarboxylase subunit gamma [Xenorhabdus sp. IM139775]
MNSPILSRGDHWFSVLTAHGKHHQVECASVKVADVIIDGQSIRYIAVVPDSNNPYPRAKHGEVGLIEGWTLAKIVNETLAEDADKSEKRAIVAIIDVPSQAYGRREEAFGIHQALAGAVAAYANARLAGHPVIGLIVGKAMSGAFLAHGYQANRLIAFNDPEVLVHAMGKAAAARITLRSVEALEKLATSIPPMAYDIQNYRSLGLLEQLLNMPETPSGSKEDTGLVEQAIMNGITESRKYGERLVNRLHAKNRSSSLLVRERMRAEW